jgi:hypothetical protein
MTMTSPLSKATVSLNLVDFVATNPILCSVEQSLEHFSQKHPLDKNTRNNKPGSDRSRINFAKEQGNSYTRATADILRQAKQEPPRFQKVSFVITLPHEMLIEQIQFRMPDILLVNAAGKSTD